MPQHYLNDDEEEDDKIQEHASAEAQSDTEPLLSPQSTSRHYQTAPLSASTMSAEILPQYVTALCATLGGFSMGAVLGFSSPAGEILTGNNTDISLTDSQNSWFSSTSNLGALIGGPVGGYCINVFGRKGTMIYSIVPFLIGWVLIAAAQNFSMLVLGRIVTGFCCGISSLTVPTYIGEFASPSIRGTLGSGFQLMVVSGILYVYCMGAAFDSIRWIAAMCAIIPCIYSVSMIFNKESPNYLLSKGKEEEAKKSLTYFRGKQYDITSELDVLKNNLEKDRQTKVTLINLTVPYVLKPFLISLGLMFFQQFSGINAVLFNLTIIFQSAHSKMSPTLSSIIVGVMQVLATLLGTVLMDKAGRKILLLISTVMMVLSQVALGTFFYLQEYNASAAESLGWLPLAALIVFIIGFSVGYGPVPWLMMGELFSSDVRELAASITTMTNWTLAFVVTLIFTPLRNGIGDYGAYWFFACFNVLSFIFVILFVYETKGKTIEEITEHFGGPPPTVTSTEEKKQYTRE